MKYMFREQNDNYTHTISHEFETVSLTDMLEHFEGFLRGCGYSFSGHLDIVDEPTFEEKEEG